AQGNTTRVPRSDAELQTLRELVASAVGFDEARGDQLTVKSLAFADLTQDGSFAAPGFMDRLALNDLAKIALIGLFALAVVLLLLRPIMRNRAPALPMLDDSLPLAPALTPALTGTIDDGKPAPLRVEPPVIANDRPEPQPLSLPPADPVARLKNMMRERHDESAKILSGWIDNKESVN
ncbi:MAG: flagellar M-ring protein FliF, partial [Paracoccus sp. (in: a-proteobacteria)]|nr:flagellar M-ring protein FliF [Paracoccus sp. (in: a-proteobacteria)]